MRKVAFISTEPDNQEKMRFRGEQRKIRHAVFIQLEEQGLEPKIHRPVTNIKDFPDVSKYYGVVIGGSKHNVFDRDIAKHPWMAKLADFVRDAHERVPVLGLCFGHQLIGKAFGGTLLSYDNWYEVGFNSVTLAPAAKDDPLFKGSPETFDALFSHFSYITSNGTSELPITPLLYSSDPNNKSLQAFRVGYMTWGVQFHPEYDQQGVADLVRARAGMIRHMVDVPKTLQGLQRAEREDRLPFLNFVEFVKNY